MTSRVFFIFLKSYFFDRESHVAQADLQFVRELL